MPRLLTAEGCGPARLGRGPRARGHDGQRTLSPGVLHGRLDCLYEGLRVRGWPVMTIANGEVVVEDGEFAGGRGAGRFVAREPSY